jgi:hypothetical protein
LSEVTRKVALVKVTCGVGEIREGLARALGQPRGRLCHGNLGAGDDHLIGLRVRRLPSPDVIDGQPLL